jgi:hypothetical protein
MYFLKKYLSNINYVWKKEFFLKSLIKLDFILRVVNSDSTLLNLNKKVDLMYYLTKAKGVSPILTFSKIDFKGLKKLYAKYAINYLNFYSNRGLSYKGVHLLFTEKCLQFKLYFNFFF